MDKSANEYKLKVKGIMPLIVDINENGTLSFYNEHKMLIAENVVEYNVSENNGLMIFITKDKKYYVFDRYSHIIVEGEIFDKWKNSIRLFLNSDNLLNSFLNLNEEDFKCTPFIDDSIKVLQHSVQDNLERNKNLTNKQALKEENDIYNLIINKLNNCAPDLVAPVTTYLNHSRELNF